MPGLDPKPSAELSPIALLGNASLGDVLRLILPTSFLWVFLSCAAIGGVWVIRLLGINDSASPDLSALQLLLLVASVFIATWMIRHPRYGFTLLSTIPGWLLASAWLCGLLLTVILIPPTLAAPLFVAFMLAPGCFSELVEAGRRNIEARSRSPGEPLGP